jgi:hypothetical protein
MDTTRFPPNFSSYDIEVSALEGGTDKMRRRAHFIHLLPCLKASEDPDSRPERRLTASRQLASTNVLDPAKSRLKVLQDEINDVFLLNRSKEHEVLRLNIIARFVSTVEPELIDGC